eukprot:s4224_g6.t1
MVMILAVMISHNREGPEYLAVIGPLLLLILFPAAATFRAYFQSVETLSEQLKEFRVNNTKCHCCSVNHVDKSGNAIPFCDREVVLRCIRNWFGSEEAFEEEAKTMLSAAIPTQLGQTLFPYPLLLVATMPLLWIMLDLAIENILFMKLDMWWLFWLISGVGWWMGSFPFFLASFFYAARCMRQPRGYRVLDWLANLLVISSILPVFIFTFGVVVILVFFTPLAEWQVALVSSAIHILTAALVWNAQDKTGRAASRLFADETARARRSLSLLRPRKLALPTVLDSFASAPADAILSMCAFLCQKGAGANSGAIGLVTMCGSAVS